MTVHELPEWRRVLVVVAHPDDESFGLGAIVDAFVRRGADVDVLCLTQGEASTLGAAADLAETRAVELRSAADVLGIRTTVLRDHPDGGLADLDQHLLAEEVSTAVAWSGAEGILVFDPSGITGHPDHITATAAAARAADELDLPVLAWSLPDEVATQLSQETGVPFIGCSAEMIDVDVAIDRTSQAKAVTCHASQAVPGSVLWRRLELLGTHEVLRWLRRPAETEIL